MLPPVGSLGLSDTVEATSVLAAEPPRTEVGMEFDDLFLMPTELRTEFFTTFERADGCLDPATLGSEYVTTMYLLIMMLMHRADRIEPDEETGVRTFELARTIRLDDARLRPLCLSFKIVDKVVWILEIEPGESNLIEWRRQKLEAMYQDELKRLNGTTTAGDAG
jgi:hypothetical protein